MHILITGASGKLGQQLIHKLKQPQLEMAALVRHKKDNLSVNQLEADILDLSSLNNVLKDKKIDLIIHLAALTHSHKLKDYFNINLEGTKNIIAAAQQNNIQRLVFVSTRAIGKSAGAYGYSKYLAEQEIKKSKLDWIIIRPSEVYGLEGQEGIDKLIKSCQSGPVVLMPGHGQYLLNPVYYQDLVDFIAKTIIQLKQLNQTYTLAGSKDYTYKKLAQELSSQFNKKNLLLPIPLFILKILSFLKLSIYPDQISRLQVPKSSDISQAAKDYNFQPLDILDYLRSSLTKPPANLG